MLAAYGPQASLPALWIAGIPACSVLAGIKARWLSAVIFLVLAIQLSNIANASDLNLYHKKQFESSQGAVLPYRILFPARYDQRKRYPLIVFLHGSGERGNDNELQLVHGGSLFLKDENRKRFPAIVVFPQCPKDGYWTGFEPARDQLPLKLNIDYSRPISAPLNAVIELTQSLIKNERVEASRVYIAGLSMGGMGTFEAVYRRPDLFAAAIAICGVGDAKAYDKRVSKIPFWIFHGAADDVVNVKHSREMVARLKQLKADVKYTEYPGVQHESWNLAFEEPDLLPWLFSKRKE